MIVLSGQVEVEIGDGTVRRGGLGEVALEEDLTGQGHLSRVVGDEPLVFVAVPLADARQQEGTLAGVKTELLFEASLELEEPQDIGATPHGTRRIVYCKGGAFTGPKLTGEVLPEGGDWVFIRPDGVRQVDVRETLRTDDGHLISMSVRGVFDVSPQTFQRLLRGDAVDPSEYYFRTTPVFETGSDRYAWLNRIVTVGSARRTPTGIKHTVRSPLRTVP